MYFNFLHYFKLNIYYKKYKIYQIYYISNRSNSIDI